MLAELEEPRLVVLLVEVLKVEVPIDNPVCDALDSKLRLVHNRCLRRVLLTRCLLLLALRLLHRHRRLLLLLFLFLLLRLHLFLLGDLCCCDDQADLALGRFGALLPEVTGVCGAGLLDRRPVVVVVGLLLEQVDLE